MAHFKFTFGIVPVGSPLHGANWPSAIKKMAQMNKILMLPLISRLSRNRHFDG
jgi:hypothetical protein